MAAVLTVLFILCFNSFAFHAAAADFHHLCQTASQAQTWKSWLLESNWVSPPVPPEQGHYRWKNSTNRWRTAPCMVQKLEATCGGASFWTLTGVTEYDKGKLGFKV